MLFGWNHLGNIGVLMLRGAVAVVLLMAFIPPEANAEPSLTETTQWLTDKVLKHGKSGDRLRFNGCGLVLEQESKRSSGHWFYQSTLDLGSTEKVLGPRYCGEEDAWLVTLSVPSGNVRLHAKVDDFENTASMSSLQLTVNNEGIARRMVKALEHAVSICRNRPTKPLDEPF